MRAALDAWAIVALLHDEPAAEHVEAAIADGAVACWVNLGEALYVETRRHGAERAQGAISSLAALIEAVDADATLTRAAASVKAAGGGSYADCFAVATAEGYGVPLLTGDPEIFALERPTLHLTPLR